MVSQCGDSEFKIHMGKQSVNQYSPFALKASKLFLNVTTHLILKGRKEEVEPHPELTQLPH